MLKVNISKSKIARPNQIKYLGFGFYYAKNGKIKPKPHMKSIEKFKRKLKQLTKRNRSISLEERIMQLNYLIREWVNYFRICDMKKVLQSITSHLCRRLRCIIWKQWKVSKCRIENLVKLGVNKDKAKRTAYTRAGYWHISKSQVLHIALPNDKLKQEGLVFSIDYYLLKHIEVVG